MAAAGDAQAGMRAAARAFARDQVMVYPLFTKQEAAAFAARLVHAVHTAPEFLPGPDHQVSATKHTTHARCAGGCHRHRRLRAHT